MERTRALNKLMSIVKQDLPDLEKNSIIPNDGGGYTAFGKFTLTPTKNNTYIVETYGNQCGEFSTVKSALSWCIAEKYKQHKLSDEIINLEISRFMLVDDIKVRSALASKFKNKELRLAVEPKINSRKDRLKLLDFRLDKCINLAKYMQIRGFSNETVRTGRTSSQRTSR